MENPVPLNAPIVGEPINNAGTGGTQQEHDQKRVESTAAVDKPGAVEAPAADKPHKEARTRGVRDERIRRHRRHASDATASPRRAGGTHRQRIEHIGLAHEELGPWLSPSLRARRVQCVESGPERDHTGPSRSILHRHASR